MKKLAPFHLFDYAGSSNAVYHASTGWGLPMHQHQYSHAVVCHAGSCVVRVKDKEIVLNRESQPIDLPANVPHEIEVLEDGTVFVNIFAKGEY